MSLQHRRQATERQKILVCCCTSWHNLQQIWLFLSLKKYTTLSSDCISYAATQQLRWESCSQIVWKKCLKPQLLWAEDCVHSGSAEQAQSSPETQRLNLPLQTVPPKRPPWRFLQGKDLIRMLFPWYIAIFGIMDDCQNACFVIHGTDLLRQLLRWSPKYRKGEGTRGQERLCGAGLNVINAQLWLSNCITVDRCCSSHMTRTWPHISAFSPPPPVMRAVLALK